MSSARSSLVRTFKSDEWDLITVFENDECGLCVIAKSVVGEYTFIPIDSASVTDARNKCFVARVDLRRAVDPSQVYSFRGHAVFLTQRVSCADVLDKVGDFSVKLRVPIESIPGVVIIPVTLISCSEHDGESIIIDDDSKSSFSTRGRVFTNRVLYDHDVMVDCIHTTQLDAFFTYISQLRESNVQLLLGGSPTLQSHIDASSPPPTKAVDALREEIAALKAQVDKIAEDMQGLTDEMTALRKQVKSDAQLAERRVFEKLKSVLMIMSDYADDTLPGLDSPSKRRRHAQDQ